MSQNKQTCIKKHLAYNDKRGHWKRDVSGKKRLGLCINTWAKSMKPNMLLPLDMGIVLQAEGKLKVPCSEPSPHLHITNVINQKHTMCNVMEK